MKTRNNKADFTHFHNKIAELQKNLEKGIAAYNEALSNNHRLKTEIDELRKDKKNQMEYKVTYTFKKALQKVKKETIFK